jgi:hypothetical protein
VREIENRKYYKDTSEVLRPASFPVDDELAAYVETLTDAGYPPEKRRKGSTPKGSSRPWGSALQL